jgi:hypothetical protein
MALPSRRCLPSIPSASVQTDLFGGPTAWARSSSAFGHILPDAFGAGLLHQCGLLHGRYTQALPMGSTQCVCACSGLRPRRVLPSLAKAGWLLLPCVRPNHVGTRKLHAYFGAQYWAYTSPVNASRTALLSFAHDSEPGRLAGPSLLGTCTPSIVPVLIGAPQRFGVQLPYVPLAAPITFVGSRQSVSGLCGAKNLSMRSAGLGVVGRGWCGYPDQSHQSSHHI